MSTPVGISQIDPNHVRDLLDEVGARNYVRVIKHAASRRDPHGRLVHRRVYDEISYDSSVTVAGLAQYDSLRAARGLKPVFLAEAIRRTGGELVSITFNLRTNVGIDFVATQLGSSSPTVQADYIALSNNTGGASATHTSSTLPWNTDQNVDAPGSGTTGEYTVLGVQRAQATYAHTLSATSYTQTKTFTASGVVSDLQLAGMFGGSARTTQGASANNILFVENTFTVTDMVALDQLTLAWTINI